MIKYHKIQTVFLRDPDNNSEAKAMSDKYSSLAEKYAKESHEHEVWKKNLLRS